MTLQEKKGLVLELISLHPSTEWYRQCLAVYMTADEIANVQNDKAFLKDVEGCLFMEKQKLIQKRYASIEQAGSQGKWQGYDKLLQEIDGPLFSIKKDIDKAEDDETAKVVYYIPNNGRD